MANRLPSRKPIRLATGVYDGPGAFSVTIGTAQRLKLLTDARVVSLCLEALRDTASREPARVLAYCFMPDHLHLLVEVQIGGNLIRFMKLFKQFSAYRYRQSSRQGLWQKGYYDHALRKEEDVSKVAEYIWHNPVRAGLVDMAEQYAFSGGALAGDLKVAPTVEDSGRGARGTDGA